MTKGQHNHLRKLTLIMAILTLIRLQKINIVARCFDLWMSHITITLVK